LHTRYRLVPTSMTLDDLEHPFRTLFQNTYVFGAHHENFNEDRVLVAFLMTPKYVTLSDFEWLEWPFYVKFSLH